MFTVIGNLKVKNMSKFIPAKELDENVYELAKQRVRKAYQMVDHVAVSFSGGKDSTAVLEVALEVARELDQLPLHVYTMDEELSTPDTIEYLERTMNRDEIDFDWWCIPSKYTNAASFKVPEIRTWDPEKKDVWFREMPSWAKTVDDLPIKLDEYHHSFITAMLFPPEKYGTVANLMGTRAEESLLRRQKVSLTEHDNYIKQAKGGPYHKGNVYHFFPIYDWRVEDVWTGSKLFGWDYNRTYDKFYKLSITARNQRVAPLTGDGLISIKVLREAYPELWGKMYQRIPGSHTAMMYADSKLFGHNGIIEKPDHYTWMEWIKEYLSRFPAWKRNELAQVIKGRLKRHYRRTGEPLPEDGSKHPLSEESWRGLMEVVFKGNNMGRRGLVITKQTGEEWKYRINHKRKKILEKAKKRG